MAIAAPTGRLALALLLAFAVLVVEAEPAGAQLTLGFEPVVTGLSSPLGLVNAGDGSGRLFTLEQTGRTLAIDRARARRSLPPFAWTIPPSSRASPSSGRSTSRRCVPR
jgi:hypothetical protein